MRPTRRAIPFIACVALICSGLGAGAARAQSVDGTFDPGASDFVYATAAQPDGKILLAGSFTAVGGGGTGANPRFGLARLNADGSIDAAFNPGANNIVRT